MTATVDPRFRTRRCSTREELGYTQEFASRHRRVAEFASVLVVSI